ncbi:TRAP transporter permease [Georgenia sp. EYE_87]|uniref:TRAP transporter permease n=1 Tax=Georgenia sp. EYE_87 TaxID=2853448 RepID=UPI0020049845|nr:TRAP transporter permease [Georgenia sp. EYE_87]MCK6210539.1 TRAP transporter permease [Georgenia sp. EYE_87]
MSMYKTLSERFNPKRNRAGDPTTSHQVPAEESDPVAQKHARDRGDGTPPWSGPRWLNRGFWATGIMLAAAAFHLYTGFTAPLPSMQQRAVHLSLGLIVVFLLYPPKSMAGARPNRRIGVVDFVLVVASAFIGVVIYLQYSDILQTITHDDFHVVLAFIAALLVLEGARRTTGPVLPALAIIAILYALFGQNLGGLFQHSGSSIAQIAGNLFLSTEGILGLAIGVSATYVVLYVIFGSLLQLCGAGEFILEQSKLMVGRFRGGQAKGATIASGMFGSISGSQVGNVAATGPVTIPLMKATGFSAKTAGAVEATASTGGMIMPPVMGATAFLIAEILQVPYAEIALAALLPALLYYLAVIFTVDFEAGRIGLKGEHTEGAVRKLGKLFLSQGYQLIPLAILVYLLIFAGTSPARAAVWGIAGAAGIIVVTGLATKNWKSIFRLFAAGATQGFQATLIIIMACGAAGIVMGMLGVTGLGFRLSYILTQLAGESVPLLLVLTMVASIILGMSLPAVAAYLILAVTVAPALADLGVEPVAAHMFVFYFGVLSAITPPVALAAFTAAGISGAPPHATAFEAVRLALAGFLIPYAFIYSPGLLLIGGPSEIAQAFISCLMGIIALAAAVTGYLFAPLKLPWRALLFAAAVVLLIPGTVSDLAGAVLLGATAAVSWTKRRRKASDSVEEKVPAQRERA